MQNTFAMQQKQQIKKWKIKFISFSFSIPLPPPLHLWCNALMQKTRKLSRNAHQLTLASKRLRQRPVYTAFSLLVPGDNRRKTSWAHNVQHFLTLPPLSTPPSTACDKLRRVEFIYFTACFCISSWKSRRRLLLKLCHLPWLQCKNAVKKGSSAEEKRIANASMPRTPVNGDCLNTFFFFWCFLEANFNKFLCIFYVLNLKTCNQLFRHQSTFYLLYL